MSMIGSAIDNKRRRSSCSSEMERLPMELVSDNNKRRSLCSSERLPMELVTDILYRLPVKSLLRFRCVSKTWLRILTVDNPFITSLHLHRLHTANPNPSLITLTSTALDGAQFYYSAHDYTTQEGDITPIHLDLPINNQEKRSYHVIGICNGLLCLTHDSNFPDQKPRMMKITIWNPLTRDHIILSCLPLPSHLQRFHDIYGFGFDQVTNQYKVVRIFVSYDLMSKHVSVCTLGTNSWRRVGDAPLDSITAISAAKTVKGAPHWLVGRIGIYHQYIMAFDIKDEGFRYIPLPFPTIDSHNDTVFMEVGGLLSIFINYHPNPNNQLEIEMWAMKEYGVASSWTKQFRTIYEMPYNKFGNTVEVYALAVANNGEITFKKPNSWGEIVIYIPGTNSFKEPKRFRSRFQCIYSYTESLISPKFINGGVQQTTLTEDRERKGLLTKEKAAEN